MKGISDLASETSSRVSETASETVSETRTKMTKTEYFLYLIQTLALVTNAGLFIKFFALGRPSKTMSLDLMVRGVLIFLLICIWWREG